MAVADPHSSDTDARIRRRAQKLWREAGRPPGGAEAYLEEARELIAIEDNPKAGTEPLNTGYNRPGPWGEPVEQSEVALDNEGEFPTTTDQGEQENPHSPAGRQTSAAAPEGSNMKTKAAPTVEERIRQRAYQLWVEEGRPHGRDQEHWDKARELIEQEQKNKEAPSAARPTVSDAGAAIDPPVKTKTAAKKKPSLKSAKSPRHS